jgi:hypothetical protein
MDVLLEEGVRYTSVLLEDAFRMQQLSGRATPGTLTCINLRRRACRVLPTTAPSISLT